MPEPTPTSDEQARARTRLVRRLEQRRRRIARSAQLLRRAEPPADPSAGR